MPRWLSRWLPEKRRIQKAKSPSSEQLIDDMNRMTRLQNEAIERENARIDETNEEDRVVSQMIEQISSHIPMDRTDWRIRFIIKKIISVHGLTEAAIAKIQRCKILLSSISDAIGPNIEMLRSVMSELSQQTASLAGRGLQFISDRIPNVMGRGDSPQGRGARSRSRSRSPSQAAVQIAPTDFVTRALSGLYDVLSRILNSAIQSCVGGACTALTRLQALSQAITTEAPAAPAECAICMGTETDSHGILGYIVGHGNGAVGHPDRFHESCLQGCHRRCPMCRAYDPVWGVQRPPGQGGGGLKKYRSKSRSKSRRYISKPRKSRKAGKRIRHALSRRK